MIGQHGSKSLFLLVGILIAQTGVSEAARYYVGTNGSNSRSKSQAQNRSTPWRSIQHAMGQVYGGDEVVVLNGTYYEKISFRRSGSAGRDIKLRAENKRKARIVGYISAYDKSYMTVDGFDVSNYNRSGLTKGIAFGRCHHVTIRNCEARECWGGGISVDKSDWILIEWNKAHHNAFNDPNQHSGISIYQPQYRSSDSRKYGIVIRNNTSWSNRNNVPSPRFGRPTDGNGIVLDDFRNSQSGGNGVWYNRQTLVENNLCYDNGGNGIHCYLSQNINIRNNTTSNNATSFDFGGEVQVSQSDRIYVHNNIFTNKRGRRAVLQHSSSNTSFTDNIIDGWTQGAWIGSSNYRGDPRFQYGFVPASYSPAVGTGRNRGDHYFLDIWGRQRIQGTIDRGAFER